MFSKEKILFKNGFSDEYLAKYVQIIHSNILSNAQLFLAACHQFGYQTTMTKADFDDSQVLDEEVVERLKALWNGLGAQESWTRYAKYHISESFPW